MKRLRLISLLMAVGLAVSALAKAADRSEIPPLVPIARLDLSRYLGHWIEIARYPNRFQRFCVGDVQADYRLLPDQRVEVINRCRTETGAMSEAVGMARQLGGPDSPRLEVRFAPAWLSFIPAVWGDYWVIDLDEDYRLAAISGPSREYLWILSRSPDVSPADYAALLERLRVRGFDLDRLQRTP